MAKGKTSSKSGLDKSPSQLLHRAVQLALDIYASEFGANGLTQRQYAVLASVASKEGLTQARLVSLTGIDRSTLADMVARMIAKGLLERERSVADARANSVRMTDLGRATLDEAQPKMASVDQRLLKLLPGGRRGVLTDLLRDLIAAADQPTADKPPKAEKTKKTKAEKVAKKKLKKSA